MKRCKETVSHPAYEDFCRPDKHSAIFLDGEAEHHPGIFML
jgi:hypothetical protein